jgi:FKBP12-rapamycin complex-associated protein
MHLEEDDQKEITEYLESVLKNIDVKDIIEYILNLKEFSELLQLFDLNIDFQILSDKAFSVRAYAKSLYFIEKEFLKKPSSAIIEKLVVLNQELQLTEAATGALDYGIKNFKNLDMLVRQRWNERLNNWKKALDNYKTELNRVLPQPAAYCAASFDETTIKTDPKELTVKKLELFLGKMRCYKGLFEWNKLNNTCLDMINCISELSENNYQRQAQSNTRNQKLRLNKKQEESLKCKIAEIGLTASWDLSDWNSMNKYVKLLPEKSYESSLYQAVLSINRKDYDQTVNYLQDARDELVKDFTSMSFDQAYPTIIKAQILSELEESVTYETQESKRESIENIWWKRLQGCEKSLENWHRLLLVRSIVLPKEKNTRSWIKFSSICQKAGNWNHSKKILDSLMNKYQDVQSANEINLEIKNDFEYCKYAYLKYLAKNDKKEAFSQLDDFVKKHLEPKFIKLTEAEYEPTKSQERLNKALEVEMLLSKSYMKLGRWLYDIDKGISDSNISVIISFYYAAKEKHKDWYKAWNAWANANYQALQFYKSRNSCSLLSDNVNTAKQEIDLTKYSIPAIQGFFKSIKLSPKNALNESCVQDTLKILSLWFEYCISEDLFKILSDGIKSVSLDIWLQVIPQLIARIDSNNDYVTNLIYQLLVDLGRSHPQALIFPIMLASNSSNTSELDQGTTNQQTKRNIVAKKILQTLIDHSSILVEQAKLVNEELIRVSILWHEKFINDLEKACKDFYGEEKNITAVCNNFNYLNKMMEQDATTKSEKIFLEKNFSYLNEARNCCNRFRHNKNPKELDIAWGNYNIVYGNSKKLLKMTSLDMKNVSPKLKFRNELELAIPGTYEPNKPIVKIKSFCNNIQIIISKQRPRKLIIKGSDGQMYPFLLKGHEDLRQDERFMQIFGLVNNLLLKNNETVRRDLAIQRYNVIPLSQNCGLLEWLNDCDTLQSLIVEYREKNEIPIALEHSNIQKKASDYEKLLPMQKLELFEMCYEYPGDDLAKILVFKSLTIENWLIRRTNYIRSLAVMSMVGYILGLGDRHPCNIMLDRATSKIIHIDFGDCFETAIQRDKYPEKVPFRLTRILINAMESTGIEGTFRHTCESVMKVLRCNCESVMTVLEAFIHDPLFLWELDESYYYSKNNVDISVNNLPVALASDNPGLKENQNLSISQKIENRKAIELINRVKDKLIGCDFKEEKIDVETQIDLLIKEATSSMNLCQSFAGWCPWW